MYLIKLLADLKIIQNPTKKNAIQDGGKTIGTNSRIHFVLYTGHICMSKSRINDSIMCLFFIINR